MHKGKTPQTISAWLTALCLSLLLTLAVGLPAAKAAGGDRTLYFYYTHTKETGKFTFRKNGQYDQKVLSQLNHFLRDWRRNEPAKMDPALFDLVWSLYQKVGATGPIYIVSAYRAPETNAMLRSRSSAVAKNSRHIQGMAMDLYIPGVPLTKLREAAMRLQVGGVGYYPTSGSPFVHVDTGNVRAWPRMTKAQLQKLFPNGETLHLPAEGDTPLSQSGYQLAKAEWVKCHSIPCSTTIPRTSFAVAQSDSDATSAGNGKTLMGWLFGNEEADEAAVDAQPAAAPVIVASAPALTPIPAARPADLYADGNTLPFGVGGDPFVTEVAEIDPSAPIPDARPIWSEGPEAADSAVFTVASINPSVAAATVPQPLPPTPAESAPFLAAYAPAAAPEPDAQRAVAMILERRAAETTQKNTAPAPDLNTIGLRAAGPALTLPDVGALTALITGTMQAVIPSANASPTSAPDFQLRQPALVAPDLAHVAELFVDPAFMSSSHYAIIISHEAADFSPATEMGALAPKLTIQSDPSFGLSRSYFSRAPLMVATR